MVAHLAALLTGAPHMVATHMAEVHMAATLQVIPHMATRNMVPNLMVRIIPTKIREVISSMTRPWWLLIVVLIGTQEDVRNTRGVNLLNGLQLQFGDSLSGQPGFSFGATRIKDALNTGLAQNTQTITQLISIPCGELFAEYCQFR